MLVLEAGDARVAVSAEDGGRIASVVVGGRELLATTRSGEPMMWGAYPMVPWAGRIRRGRFTFEGRRYELPISLPPHAIHGVVYDRPWRVVDDRTIAIELDERWPFRGRVVESFAVDEGGLLATLRLEADEPMPGMVGWHPWFRRVISDGGEPVKLRFEPREMLVRDDDGIPRGERVTPPPGPWDDAFTGLKKGPALEWPGELRLQLTSTCDWWVVYDIPPDTICVEPQSGPPDAANIAPEIVEPGRPLVHEMRWRWERLG